MDKTYFTIKLDLEAVDAQIRRILELRNEMAMAVEKLGDTMERELFQLKTEKAPGCSGNCKRGNAESTDAAKSNAYNLVVEKDKTVDIGALSRNIADACML